MVIFKNQDMEKKLLKLTREKLGKGLVLQEPTGLLVYKLFDITFAFLYLNMTFFSESILLLLDTFSSLDFKNKFSSIREEFIFFNSKYSLNKENLSNV